MTCEWMEEDQEEQNITMFRLQMGKISWCKTKLELAQGKSFTEERRLLDLKLLKADIKKSPNMYKGKSYLKKEQGIQS